MKKIFVSLAALAMLAAPLAIATSAPAMADGFKSCLTKTISGADIPADRLAAFCTFGSIHEVSGGAGKSSPCASGQTHDGKNAAGKDVCIVN